ncbi:MAG: hypothetical protein WC774_04760 [Candidatus Gracilibacteria bacterium]
MSEIQDTQPETPEEKKIRKAKEAIEEAEKEKFEKRRNAVIALVGVIFLGSNIKHETPEKREQLMAIKNMEEKQKRQFTPAELENIKNGGIRTMVTDNKTQTQFATILSIEQIMQEKEEGEKEEKTYIPCQIPSGEKLVFLPAELDGILRTCSMDVQKLVENNPLWKEVQTRWTQEGAIEAYGEIRRQNEAFKQASVPYQTCKIPTTIIPPTETEINTMLSSCSNDVRSTIKNDSSGKNGKYSTYETLSKIIEENKSMENCSIPPTVQIPSADDLRTLISSCNPEVQKSMKNDESWQLIQKGTTSPEISLRGINNTLRQDHVFADLAQLAGRKVIGDQYKEASIITQSLSKKGNNSFMDDFVADLGYFGSWIPEAYNKGINWMSEAKAHME